MVIKNNFARLWNRFNQERHIAPLVVLRVAFGLVMLISTLRFIARGWVSRFYIEPKFHFTFYGFEWVRPLAPALMYAVFAIMILATLFVMMGLRYRISVVVFFVCFLYTELIDKTYYLNHYYLVSLITFLLILVPAHRYCSLDVLRKPSLKITRVPGWTINIFKWQMCLVYFCAGLSKLTFDWMIRAMPLRIWLPANAGLPVIGPWLEQSWIAYAFSWFAAVFDLSIGFLLLNKRTRTAAYMVALLFHLVTGWLFKIGMFPYIMIVLTLIFFSENFHLRLIRLVKSIFYKKTLPIREPPAGLRLSVSRKRITDAVLIVYAVFQTIIPFRFLLYPGKLLWTEQGYRFSWRVMLMEKAGTTYFYVKDRVSGRKGEVLNRQFLTPFQERMMETQPDMILQYAHYLHDYYRKKGMNDPIVTVESYVTLNGSGSRLYLDSTVDLSRQKEDLLPKKWILPFHQHK